MAMVLSVYKLRFGTQLQVADICISKFIFKKYISHCSATCLAENSIFETLLMKEFRLELLKSLIKDHFDNVHIFINKGCQIPPDTVLTWNSTTWV